nr:hypothetical protein BAR15_160028 [Bartonella sp. AR 15-3]
MFHFFTIFKINKVHFVCKMKGSLINNVLE